MFRIITLFIVVLASRATAAEVRLTLDNAAAYAQAHNLPLAAAQLRIEEARGRLRQAGLLSNPELEVDYARNIQSPENRLGVSLMQRFPVTDRLRLARSVSQAELDAAAAEVRDEERKLGGEARIAVVKLLGVRGQVALRERQLVNSRDLAEFTRSRVQAAEASVVEATEVDLDAAQFEAELIQLQAEAAILTGELRVLVSAAPGDVVMVEGELPPVQPPPSGAVELGRRPDFAAAQHKSAAARHAAALARAQRFEDVGVGLMVEREYTEDAPEGLESDVMAGVRVRVPLPLWNRNQGSIQEAAAISLRAGREANALGVTIRAEAAAAREQIGVLGRLAVSLSDVLLPKAAQIEEQLRSAYSTGQSPLTEVLRARDKRLLLERQRVDALRDYHLARVRYAIATGQTSAMVRSSGGGK